MANFKQAQLAQADASTASASNPDFPLEGALSRHLPGRTLQLHRATASPLLFVVPSVLPAAQCDALVAFGERTCGGADRMPGWWSPEACAGQRGVGRALLGPDSGQEVQPALKELGAVVQALLGVPLDPSADECRLTFSAPEVGATALGGVQVSGVQAEAEAQAGQQQAQADSSDAAGKGAAAAGGGGGPTGLAPPAGSACGLTDPAFDSLAPAAAGCSGGLHVDAHQVLVYRGQ